MEEISAKDISVTYNAIGDHSKHVDEGVSVSSPKDGQLIVADAGATGSIPEALEGDQTNKIQNDDDVPSKKSSEHTPSPQDFGLTGDFGESLPIVTPLKVQQPHDDGSYSSIDRCARIPDVAIPEYIPQNTPEKVKEYIDLLEEEIDVDDSHLESLISDIEKSIENYSSTYEDIKKVLGEEVGKNDMEDVGSTKMEQVSVHNEEKEIADDKNKLKAESTEGIDSYNDLSVANYDIIVSRTLQLQRNKYLAELSDQERILDDFLFYSEYKDVSILSIDEELRHNLECLVLLDIVNPANPDMHVCMTKMDFLSLAPKTWLTRASIEACSYLFNRREEEKPGTPRGFWFNILPFNYINLLIDERKKKEYVESIISEKEIDLEKAKDNSCYDTMKAEWLKDKQKMTYRDVMFCKVFCKVIELSVVVLMVFTIRIDGLFLLLGEVIKMTLIVVFIVLKLWNGMTVGMRKSIRLLHFQQYAYTKNLSRCHFAIDLVSYKENRRKHEVFKECALWSARKPFLIE
ncbi:NUT family member 2F [Bienertia sinuspersici]